MAWSLVAACSSASAIRAGQRAAPSVMAAPNRGLPRAVVFDLDGCLWEPDMYMLWGGGAPFRRSERGDLIDCRGQAVRMLGAVPEILHELKTDSRWAGTVVAVASCTDEPAWADECMRKFQIGSEYCIKDVMQVLQITKGNKQGHLRRIAEQTGISLEQMLFLDNERWNCDQVSAIGVSVAYAPDGVTARVWERALAAFPCPGRIIDPG